MLDLRFYFALFLRRLPYFLILTVAGAALGVALALTLPPTFEAQARLVVESEQTIWRHPRCAPRPANSCRSSNSSS